MIATPGSSVPVSFLVFEDDGLTPATGHAGNQPDLIVDGVLTSSGITTLTAVAGYAGMYTATVTCPATACTVEPIYTYAGVLPSMAPTIQVGDPLIGTGAKAVTLSIVDGTPAAIGGCPVLITNSGGQQVAAAETALLTGQATVNLPQANDYVVTLGPLAGYSFANPYDLDVSASATQSKTLTATKAAPPAAPTSPSLCRVYAYMYTEDGTPVTAADGKLEVTRVVSHATATGAVIADGTDGNSDANGLAYIDIVRGAVVQVTGTWPTGRKVVADVTVPAAATYDISGLLQAAT